MKNSFIEDFFLNPIKYNPSFIASVSIYDFSRGVKRIIAKLQTKFIKLNSICLVLIIQFKIIPLRFSFRFEMLPP